MLWKYLRSMLIFWLSAVLLCVLFIKVLPAEEISPSLSEIKSNLLTTSIQLGKLNNKLLIELTDSKKNLLQSQQELTQLQAQLTTVESSLASSQDSFKLYQKDVSAEISHLKWSRVTWCIGGFVVGVGAGLIIAALVK